MTFVKHIEFIYRCALNCAYECCELYSALRDTPMDRAAGMDSDEFVAKYRDAIREEQEDFDTSLREQARIKREIWTCAIRDRVLRIANAPYMRPIIVKDRTFCLASEATYNVAQEMRFAAGALAEALDDRDLSGMQEAFIDARMKLSEFTPDFLLMIAAEIEIEESRTVRWILENTADVIEAYPPAGTYGEDGSAGVPDSPDTTDTQKFLERFRRKRMPRSPDVLDLCQKLANGLSDEKNPIDIAREFTDGNERKAASLMRQARRYRHLWDGNCAADT